MTKQVKTVRLAVELTDEQARPFAEFLSFISGSSVLRDKVQDDKQVYDMQAAAYVMRFACVMPDTNRDKAGAMIIGYAGFDRLATAAAKLSLAELYHLAARIAAMIEDRKNPRSRRKIPTALWSRNATHRPPRCAQSLSLAVKVPAKCVQAGGNRPSHGPYWYAYWKEGGRIRSQYIGKELPADRQ